MISLHKKVACYSPFSESSKWMRSDQNAGIFYMITSCENLERCCGKVKLNSSIGLLLELFYNFCTTFKSSWTTRWLPCPVAWPSGVWAMCNKGDPWCNETWPDKNIPSTSGFGASEQIFTEGQAFEWVVRFDTASANLCVKFTLNMPGCKPKIVTDSESNIVAVGNALLEC